MKLIDPAGKTNWEFLAIVVVVAVLVGFENHHKFFNSSNCDDLAICRYISFNYHQRPQGVVKYHCRLSQSMKYFRQWKIKIQR